MYLVSIHLSDLASVKTVHLCNYITEPNRSGWFNVNYWCTMVYVTMHRTVPEWRNRTELRVNHVSGNAFVTVELTVCTGRRDAFYYNVAVVNLTIEHL